jgi:biopolymer transport protein ExbD
MEMWFDHTGVDDRGIHRKRARPGKSEDAAEINLTPMLDVVMIMLIFFLVAGSFIREVGVEIERKQTSSAESSGESDAITIQVSATNEIWVKNRRIDARAVRANISRMRAENPKASVIIKAHNASTINAVTKVLDASREAGVYDVSLSTGGDAD